MPYVPQQLGQARGGPTRLRSVRRSVISITLWDIFGITEDF